MLVELEFKITIDGASTAFTYELKDGCDQAFCDLVNEARKKLSHKMKALIDDGCK